MFADLIQVVRDARRRQAVVLTTHSMEEAEQLCDRLGIFVDGRLQCVGNPQVRLGPAEASVCYSASFKLVRHPVRSLCKKGSEMSSRSDVRISASHTFVLARFPAGQELTMLVCARQL